jgi:hypothetical protein
MQIPPGGGNNPREAQELEARFSALSAEISASLDTILATLERSPGDEHAIAVARELVAAQHSVTQQLLMLSQQGAVRGLAAPQYAPRLAPPAQSRPLSAAVAPKRNQPCEGAGAQPAHSARYPASHQPDFDLPYQAREAPTLADLLRDHLSALPPQPGESPMPMAGPMPVQQHQPLPRQWRPHALELAPMTLPTTNHVVWAEHVQGLAPSLAEPQDYPAEPMPFSAPVAVPAMTKGRSGNGETAMPSWVQAAARPYVRRSGLWAGGALAAIVTGLGMTLNAGNSPDQSAPHPAETYAAATSEAEADSQPLETASTKPSPVQREPERIVAATAATYPIAHGLMVTPPAELPGATGAQRGAVPEPPAPPEHALLPSAQNWLDANASGETATPVRPFKAKPPVSPAPEPKASAPAKPKAQTAKVEPVAPVAKPAAKKTEIAPFKTAVVQAKKQELFVPVLVELKSADALPRIFQDLQGRHSALAGKRSEVRPAAGPNNETWFALLAVPAAPKAEAETICRAMGAEGASLRCRVIKY